VNALALAALRAVALRPASLHEAAGRAARERSDLVARVGALGRVRLWPSHTNFVLVEVPDGPAVVTALRARNVAVRHATTFPGLGDDHLRLTARDPAANTRLAAALDAVTAP
jgi:histidinol-phosphate aminotransferase